ncbi:MAG: 50S ribosomal protein L23 [Candidatus Woesearchaeota archaeon]
MEKNKNKFRKFEDEMDVIKYPMTTEKSIRLLESENKLVFIVERKATKQDIKKAVETMFKVKVVDVNTLISVKKAQKKAYVKLSKETPAIDIATQLGML